MGLRAEHGSPGAFARYGMNTHTCLGTGLAEAQLVLTVASLLCFGLFELDLTSCDLKIRPLPPNSPTGNFRLKRVR